MFNSLLTPISLALALASAVVAHASDLRPNIVHIMVDDLGWQDVACYYRGLHDEEPFYETPNLDRFAEQGIRFTQAYSPAVTCAPSRASYLTGQYTPHNGVYHVNMGCQIPRLRRESNTMLDPYYVGRLMPGKPVIGKALKQAGYTTAHVGKWHVSGASGYPAPIQVGFDFSFDHLKQYNDPDIYDENDPKQTNFPGLFAQPKHRLKDAFNDPRYPVLQDDRPYDSMTDLSQRWIRKAALGDKPFFLNLCPNLVHGPVMTRDRKRLAHYCQKLGIPFPTDQGSISNPDKPGQHNPYYASMVDSVDWIIGQILHTLETTDDPRNNGHKLIDNTYVFISSDNGGAQKLRNWKNRDGKIEFEKVTDNAPLRAGKAWAYEGGCRIPFLVMGPGIEAGSVNTKTPINLIDLFPTFLAIAGGKGGKLALDGCNILPVIKGQQQTPRFTDGKPRDTVYFHYPVLNAAFSTIRRGPWKLMKNTGGSLNTAPGIQLFRLYNEDGSSNDLSETKNLASEYPEITKQMLADLDRWLKDHSAEVPYKNAVYKPGSLPGQKEVPKVIRRRSEGATLSVWVEKGKSEIADAFLLYTVNPGKTEEWFRAGVRVNGDRIDAEAPPGMTHGVFCLIDENHFLITSEPIPSMQKLRLGQPVSQVLKDGFAYRPGLFSLIKLANRAQSQAEQRDQKNDVLLRAIRSAEQTVKKPVNADRYTKAMRDLRQAIRSLNVPATRHPALNWFPRSADQPAPATKPVTRPPPDLTKPIKVYLLSGQSNMVGFGSVSGNGTTNLETLVHNDGRFPHLGDGDGGWSKRSDVFYVSATSEKLADYMSVATAGANGRIGPEVQFGYLLGDYHDEMVLILKIAQGNRSIGFDVMPPSSRIGVSKEGEFYKGWQYDDFVEDAHRVLDNLKKYYPDYQGQGYEIAGFCWWQGHKDAGISQRFYEKHLVNLIKDLRKEFKAPKMNAVIATVAFGGMGMEGPYLEIAKAQVAVSDPKKYPAFKGNVASVDCRPFFRGGGAHYGGHAETYMLVGDGLGRAMIKLLKKEPIVYKPLESGARRKVITTGPPPNEKKPVKVYILSGQSNMVGMGQIAHLETVAKTNPKFKHLMDKNGNWVARNDVHFVDLTNFRVAQPLTVGVPPYYDVFGPDVQFGNVMGDHHDELVLVIKAAQGNRSIGFDINPPSSRKGVPKTGTFYPGWQYDIFVGNIRKTLDNLKEYVPQYKGQGYEIAGFCWWQGHKDKGMSQDVYEYHLANLINDLRKEFNAPKAPFSIATVGFEGENLPENWHGVLKAQMAVSNGKKYPDFAGNVATVDTRPFWRGIAVSPREEGHHYNRNAETYLLVGDALARNIIKLTSDKTKNEEGN